MALLTRHYSSRGLPAWAKGQMRNCVVCDWWFPERDYRMRYIKGKWFCKWCDDSQGFGDQGIPPGEPPTRFLKLEDDGFYLFEDGGKIVLEDGT